jgi:hypothetical protein
MILNGSFGAFHLARMSGVSCGAAVCACAGSAHAINERAIAYGVFIMISGNAFSALLFR